MNKFTYFLEMRKEERMVRCTKSINNFTYSLEMRKEEIIVRCTKSNQQFHILSRNEKAGRNG